jgi:hypothetical protein
MSALVSIQEAVSVISSIEAAALLMQPWRSTMPTGSISYLGPSSKPSCAHSESLPLHLTPLGRPVACMGPSPVPHPSSRYPLAPITGNSVPHLSTILELSVKYIKGNFNSSCPLSLGLPKYLPSRGEERRLFDGFCQYRFSSSWWRLRLLAAPRHLTSRRLWQNWPGRSPRVACRW